MVTDVPGNPEVGEMLVMLGTGTVNVTPLLNCPLTFTLT
jgi:hypothetical protein